MRGPPAAHPDALRIGTVPYVVSWPLLEGLADDDLQVEADVPATLVDRLRDGTLDVALASSIELFRTPGSRAVSNIGIVAQHEVMSVMLFARKPRAEVRSIALDPSSRTAAVLLRVLLAHEQRDCELVEVKTGLDPTTVDADAFLQIGDPALKRVAEERSRSGLEIHDLATWWREQTGLPFVFAVWLVRPGADLRDLPSKLERACARGLANLEAIIARAADHTGISRAIMTRYLKDVCSYDLRPEAVGRGLREFGARAAALDLADPAAKLEFYASP